jgi:hypothetical protein
VIGVDEFALCRRHRYAMIITDAETGRRVAVLPDPARAVLQSWLRTSWCRGRVPRRLGHLRRGNPPCPARRGAGQRPTAPLESPLRQSPTRGPRAHRLLGHRQPAPSRWSTRVQHPRTLEKIHDLLSQGVGLLDWSRRLDLALNTV